MNLYRVTLPLYGTADWVRDIWASNKRAAIKAARDQWDSLWPAYARSTPLNQFSARDITIK